MATEEQKLENRMDDEESIKVLYEGKEPISADIVFVHGLTGNGLATWEKGNTVWPRDLLPKAVPAARVITWNYDADIMRFFNKTSQNTILKHAENLLVDLAGERAEEDGIEPDRPIIFVGHSLGGLVIKQALITAREHEAIANENDDYANIIRNTIGIIFLGTPHKGSDQAKWDGIATNLAKVLRKDHNDTIVSALSRGSSTLESLQSSFRAISDRFSYATFTEEREYPNIGKIVDDESAVLYLPKETIVVSLPANHLGLSRFGSAKETGFKRVVIAIKALLRAPAMRDPIRHNSASSVPQVREFQGYGDLGAPPARGYPPAAYDSRRYPPDAPGQFYEPNYYPPARSYPGYGPRSGYGSPNYDERALPIMLDRVSIAPSVTDSDTLAGDSSPTSNMAPPVAGDTLQQSPKEVPEDTHEEISEEVADVVAAGEEAAPEEESTEEEEPQEPAVPSPITRDIYVRLVQEFSDKDKVPSQEFQDGLSRINFYRRRIAERIFLKRAREQVEQDHAISEDVQAEIAARIYSPTHESASCDVCSEAPDAFHHCVVCNNNNYDICQSCLDKGSKCPGSHPLIKFTKTTEEGATGEPQPEDESIFPVSDPLEEFDVDDQESIIRTLYLAALLGDHDDIIAAIVQYGVATEVPVNNTPDFGTSRIRLTPLALAILMGRDDNVSSLLNVQPNMLVYTDTVYPVEDAQEQTLQETESIREEMGDETADPESQSAEEATEETSTDNAESEDFHTVSETVAIEAINLAASHGNAQTTKLLLLQWDRNPLPEYCLLHDAAEYGHAESVDLLINWGADIEGLNPYYNRTPLLHAVFSNADIAKIETLIRRRANVNAQDRDSKTALHYAASYNRLDMVQMLVEAGANVEIEDNEGNTPIHFVVEQPEYYPVAKYMVQKGVSLKHKNKAGMDPLNLALNSSAENGDTYFMLAVSLQPMKGKKQCTNSAYRAARYQGGGVRNSIRRNHNRI